MNAATKLRESIERSFMDYGHGLEEESIETPAASARRAGFHLSKHERDPRLLFLVDRIP